MISSRFNKYELLEAAKKNGLDSSQAEGLWQSLAINRSGSSLSRISRVLYFLGALIICLALAWFMGDRYVLYGAAALLPISLVYAIGFLGAGLYLWRVKGNQTLGGLAVFLSIILVPLITYSLQDLINWWPGQFPGQYSDFFCWIRGGWAIMELSTISITLIALYFIKFPLLTLILYTALWFMSMDLASAIHSTYLMQIRIALSMLLGVSLTMVAYMLDRKGKEAFAFWGYLFGVAILWGAISSINYNGWIESWIYCFTSLVMIILSPLLKRRVFLVFGIIGIIGYLFMLSYNFFANSTNFPFILSVIGLLVIIFGTYIQRKWSGVVIPINSP